MSPIITGVISVVVSVAVMIAYNYFTTSNTHPLPQNIPADVPIGTMVPYAGKDIPAGWIACDNAAYPTTTYPQLYAAIGFTYGMDGSNYRVPDTRGVFMRGIDATATRDTNRPAGSIQLSGTVPDTNSVFTGASASATGGVGYVPAPLAGQDKYVLNGSGKWSAISNYFSPVTLSGQNAVGFINIPPSATEITVMFRGISISSSTSDFVVQLGYGTGPTYVDSGYIGNATLLQNSAPDIRVYTSGFGIWTNNTVTAFTGIMKISLLDPSTNTWISSQNGALNLSSLSTHYGNISSAYMSLTSGPLTAIRVMASASAPAVKFSGGTINVKYTT